LPPTWAGPRIERRKGEKGARADATDWASRPKGGRGGRKEVFSFFQIDFPNPFSKDFEFL
jgi:hypothetical protein